ncbi:MAG: hypothetical protein AABX73_01880 [Nanoarchaeota archaeon]
MAGIVAVIVKIMPESSKVDIGGIWNESEKRLKNLGAMNISFEERAIAFGLKALMIKFAWPEEKDTDMFERALSEIGGVSSVNVEDYRRAFG